MWMHEAHWAFLSALSQANWIASTLFTALDPPRSQRSNHDLRSDCWSRPKTCSASAVVFVSFAAVSSSWYSDEQRLNSTRVGLSVSKYPRFQVAFSLLVCCQHHNYLIHPLLKPSRQQWRPQLHTTTHIPQATIPHLCSVYLYSTQRQITPTTTHPILDSASPAAKMLSSQR